jgi:hypothetical protein
MTTNRHTAGTVWVALAALVLVACGDDDPEAGSDAATTVSSIEAEPTTSVEVTSAPSVGAGSTTMAPVTSLAAQPQLAEGTYHTEPVTGEQMRSAVLAAGFDESEVDANFRPEAGPIIVGLRLADGGWSQLYSANGEPEYVGWRGTYEVIDGDTVVASDPCGPITYSYALEGDQLSLDVEDDQCPTDGVQGLIIQTALFETAPFTLDPPVTDEPTAAREYDGASFVAPFTVTPPEWAPAEPSTASPTFVTWEGTDADRAIRFLAPVNLYPPGSATAEPVPDDYATYLLGLTDQGAQFTDVLETTVGGRPATVLTASTTNSLDGVLGCPDEGMTAADCYGIQADLVIRLAVIDTGSQIVLVWVRDILGDGQRDIEYDSFDAMLASLAFT